MPLLAAELNPALGMRFGIGLYAELH